MNARSAGVRSSAFGRTSPARAATTGSTPSPMTKAPPAQTPYSIIAPAVVAGRDHQLCEKLPTTAEKKTIAPVVSTTAPTQSQAVHDARQRCPASLVRK